MCSSPSDFHIIYLTLVNTSARERFCHFPNWQIYTPRAVHATARQEGVQGTVCTLIMWVMLQ